LTRAPTVGGRAGVPARVARWCVRHGLLERRVLEYAKCCAGMAGARRDRVSVRGGLLPHVRVRHVHPAAGNHARTHSTHTRTHARTHANSRTHARTHACAHVSCFRRKIDPCAFVCASGRVCALVGCVL
jgi:hypothetical protein